MDEDGQGGDGGHGNGESEGLVAHHGEGEGERVVRLKKKNQVKIEVNLNVNNTEICLKMRFFVFVQFATHLTEHLNVFVEMLISKSHLTLWRGGRLFRIGWCKPTDGQITGVSPIYTDIIDNNNDNGGTYSHPPFHRFVFGPEGRLAIKKCGPGH